jgi:hypothetical protein
VTSSYTVGLPNGNTMAATHTALLPINGILPPLSTLARRAHVFPSITNNPLLSIGQFCDDGYDATFTADAVLLSKQGKTFKIGTRNHINGLWNVDLSTIQDATVPSPPNTIPDILPRVNSAQTMKTLSDLVQYLHRACFSPVIKTWTQAIDAGRFTTWPGLTSGLVRKHLPKSLATAKGHLRMDRKNVRSTKQPINQLVDEPSTMTTSELSIESNVRTHCAFTKIVTFTGKVFSDQTGRFPQTSSRGNKSIMIFYDYDSNAILAEPLKSHSGAELLRAFTKLHEYLAERGLPAALHILDNECPQSLKEYIKKTGATLQLAPPNMHRTNAAEKAIDIWKCHFIAGLSTVHPEFPMHLWCRLIEQATTTLNLLRPARTNPKLSAYAQLNGAFDYNRTPLAPPGSKVLIHETPANRRTWDPHGVDGWYIGGAPEHYRCHRVYVSKTRAERIAKTVEFFPHNCPMPKTSSADAATQAARDLISALQNPAPAAPFATLGNEQLHAIRKLADIFQVATESPTTAAPNPVSLPRVPTATNPVASPRVTTTPVAPPRVPVTATPIPQHGPHLIQPEPDDPVLHRYPLRSSVANAANAVFQPEANAVMDPITGESLEYRALSTGPDKDIWITALANDLGRLAQGIGTRKPSGTNTIFFVKREAVPNDRKVTYGRLVSSLRPTKAETHRVRVTVGGDKLDYPGLTTTQCASLTTTKCHLNSVLSTPNAKYVVLDIKDFYYGTQMQRYEYMKLPIKLIPQEVIDQYNLLDLVSDGYIYIEIRKGMPGLKQAGRLANDRLQTHLKTFGYAPVPRTPSLWTHESRPVSFTLVVDDFGVKYIEQKDADHLIHALKQLYEISIDWTGSLYLGLTLKWDYNKRTVEVSMPGYVRAALLRFQHPAPTRRQDAPHSWNQPTYGAKVQYADDPDDGPPLSAQSSTHVQKIVGVFLYYGMAIDSTMLVSLGSIATTQANATQKTMDEATWLLDYAASNPDAIIKYHASGMILHIHSDGSYLSEPKARSRAAGHYFLSDLSLDPSKPPTVTPTPNGAIYSLSRIIRNVMGSAAEAEIASSYMNGQEAIPIRTTLEEMGHPQPPTPMQVDNSTAEGFANDTIKQKRSKAIDMRFYWIQDRTRQGQFLIYWRPGADNLADYHSKHHSAAHKRLLRPKFLHPSEQLAHNVIHLLLRGCVKSRGTRGTHDPEEAQNPMLSLATE